MINLKDLEGELATVEVRAVDSDASPAASPPLPPASPVDALLSASPGSDASRPPPTEDDLATTPREGPLDEDEDEDADSPMKDSCRLSADDESGKPRTYTLGKRLGSGGNSVTHLCTCTSTGQLFAQKRGIPSAGHSLAAEAHIYQLLGDDASGIAKFEGFGQNMLREPVIVMELLGKPLGVELEACGGTVGLRTALVVGIDVITAFETLHQKGHLYAYLKLDSFLVTLARDGVRLVDFGRTRTLGKGLADRYPVDPDHDSFWNSKGRVCSVAYQDGQLLGPRDDIHSAGLLILYLLQGYDSLPWARNPTSRFKRLAHEQSAIEDLPPYFRRVLEYCLVTAPKLAVEELPNYEMLKEEMRRALEEASVTDDSQDLPNAPPPLDGVTFAAAESGSGPGDAPRKDDVDPAAPAVPSVKTALEQPHKETSHWVKLFRPKNGPFTLGKQLGSGNNGTTYGCTCDSTGEKFAVKIEAAESDDTSLLAEAEIYLALGGDGHGIAKYEGIGWSCFGRGAIVTERPLEWNCFGHRAIVLERLGTSLQRMLDSCGGTLGLRTVLVIGLDMISAFESLHKKDFIYCWLKLDSFLVTRSHDGVRLVDFGRTRTRARALEKRMPYHPNYIKTSSVLHGLERLPWARTPISLLKNAAIDHSGIEDLPPYFQRVIKYCILTAQDRNFRITRCSSSR
ncbi:hypothetical protein RQP46_001432 [Phenoliferia psychrophenolica]